MVVQTTEDMIRECVGTIWRACDAMAKDAEDMDIPSMKVRFNFIKAQMDRLKLLQDNMPVRRREL